MLRPAVPGDMATVADIWHRAWHVAHSGHVPDGLTAGRTLGAFRERTPSRAADTTVAVVDGRVVGFAMVADDEVEQVFVDPELHGSGVAAPLLADAERRVAAGGHDVAWLAVVVGNARARRFYEKHGWADAGDLPYEVTALGERFVSPCRRYEKRVRRPRSGPVIRPATSADAEAVARVWHDAWHDAHDGQVPAGLVAVRTREDFAERVDALLPRALVAEVDGEVAGFVTVLGEEVELLFVDRPHRGTGVAATLLTAAEDRGGRWLSVVDGNARARRFYERQGYADAGTDEESVTVRGATYVVVGRRYEKRVLV